MNFIVRRIIYAAVLTVIAFTTAIPAKAQSGKLTMTIKDTSNGEAVPFATVSLTKHGAKSPAKYILTDENGKAVISRIVHGQYLLKAELLGYKPYTKEINVTGSQDLGDIGMEPDKEVLDAASVTAAGNPIIVKKDTIEFNASSFRTTDNDMLETLIKKMPGMEVAEDGSVTFNGKAIDKITIDGQTFFLNDPQLATKNIPSKVVDKLKVINKKSDQAEFTGIDDGEEETIIDLSLRPDMKNGFFGNFMAGGGHDIPQKQSGATLSSGDGDWRYQGAGFMGKFTDKGQISIVLNGNNTNNRGFNNLAGSMMSGMRSGGMGRGRGGWDRGNGITTSWMGGLNANTKLFDNKMNLSGNYLYNGTRKNVEEKSSKTTYLDNRNLIYDNNGFSIDNTDGNRIGARIEHKFSENTSILFQPQFNVGSGNFNEFSEFNTRSQMGETEETTNNGFKNNNGKSKSVRTNGFLLFRQRLGIPGRTLSVNFRYDFSNVNLDGFNRSLTSNYSSGAQKDSIVNQRYSQNKDGKSMSARLSYTEPLGNNFFLEANYRFGWSRNTSSKDTYDSGDNPIFDKLNHEYICTGEAFNTVYSNDILNRYINQQVGANFRYQKDKLRAQIGANLNPTNTHNVTNGTAYDSKVLNWAPSAMLWYDINDNTNARLFYRGRSSQPSTSQLMPVPDNTNPLNVSFGNPYLLPYFSNSLWAEFRSSNKTTFTSVNLNIEGNMVSKQIVNASWYDNNGVQYSIPVNGRNSGNVNSRLFINAPIAKSGFYIFSMTRMSYSGSSSYIGSRFDTSKYYENGEFDYEVFHKDFPDLYVSPLFKLNRINSINATQRLRLTYRDDIVELTFGGRTRFAKSWYTVASAKTKMTWNNRLDASMNWTIPGGIGLVADAGYNWYRGYSTPQKDELILNAEITKLLFKDKMTLSLKAYDIFNQSKNLSINDLANYHTETWNNTLGRYVIASLTWRFGNFSNAANGMGGYRGGYGGGRYHR